MRGVDRRNVGLLCTLKDFSFTFLMSLAVVLSVDAFSLFGTIYSYIRRWLILGVISYGGTTQHSIIFHGFAE